jgi:hypothetical protein
MMALRKAGNLSTLTPDQLQAQCEELCFQRPPVKAYNVLIEGLEILYEAGIDGNVLASKRLVHLAEEATQAATGFEKSKYMGVNRMEVLIAAETLFEAAVNGNMEGYKRLVHLTEEVIQAAGDKDL